MTRFFGELDLLLGPCSPAAPHAHGLVDLTVEAPAALEEDLVGVYLARTAPGSPFSTTNDARVWTGESGTSVVATTR